MTNAERQAAWRKRNPFTAKWKQRERMARLRWRGKEAVVRNVRNETLNVRNAPITTPREVQETYYTGSMDEVEGDGDVMREQREMMERGKKGPPVAPPVRKDPEEKVVSERELKAVQDLAAIVGRRKASREVEVPWE